MVIKSPLINIQTPFLHMHKAYFSGRVGDDSTSSLLADAAFCAQTLELHSASAIEKQYNSSLEQQVAKRALWFLNSLEKPRCLAEGLLPVCSARHSLIAALPCSYAVSDCFWRIVDPRRPNRL